MGQESPEDAGGVDLFLCGDVMTGRGVDQILRHPSDPVLYEPYETSALAYVQLAEQLNGPIPRGVDGTYVWGEALAELDRRAPDVRIVNLETSITTSPTAVPKGINYRMHPANAECLRAARVDCCVLANNHVLDWGVAGLMETLETLEATDIEVAGAGRDAAAASAPAILAAHGPARVLVFGLGCSTSGIPSTWAAGEHAPGIRMTDLSEASADCIAEEAAVRAQRDDIVVVSLHSGGNWGYAIPAAERRFAHQLVDTGRVHVVHGHSSHHPKGIEVYRGRLILYGCGDFIDDYEGISGYEELRADLVLAYFVRIAPASGRLVSMEMAPFQSRRFRLERPSAADVAWLSSRLDRECRRLGTHVEAKDEALSLAW